MLSDFKIVVFDFRMTAGDLTVKITENFFLEIVINSHDVAI